MRDKAMNEALRLVRKVASDPRVDPDRRDQLQKARRELEALMRSGRPTEKNIFRLVAKIALILLDSLSTK